MALFSLRYPRWLLLGILVGFVGLLPALPARAQTGQITGTVVIDSRSAKPLAYANVMVVGTSLGAVSKEDGSFQISGVPTGRQTVQATFIGYEAARADVTVISGEAAKIQLRLKETVARKEKEILVSGERPLVEVEKASTIRSYNKEELKRITAQPTIDSVVEQQPGVTRDQGQIHIRGGRADETLYIIDGVKMKDVLTGESDGTNVSSRSIAELNIITGGFDAKYGQALSGVVEASLKEGDEDFHGYLGYQTDRLTSNWKTDLLSLQLSGKLPVLGTVLHAIGGEGTKAPTCFLDFASDLGNGYLPSIKSMGKGKSLNSSYRDQILGSSIDYGKLFYPRANNHWRLLFKTGWRVSASDKLDLSLTKSLTFNEGFGSHDVSSINQNTVNYAWQWSRRFDHYYTDTNDKNTLAFNWRRGFSASFSHVLNITRYFSSYHRDVGGQLWTQYNRDVDTDLPDPTMDTPYFRDVGDATGYEDRYVETWSVSSDWQKQWKRHEVKWGLSSQYENVQYMTLDASSYVPPDTTTGSPGKPLGDSFDLFHVYPNTGALYVQDKIDYEGMIARIGLRWDYWFPGQQVEDLYKRADRPTINAETRQQFYHDTGGLFGHRYKAHLSPRISVSHPITQRDNLFFNYGHFSERPAYFYVYAKSSSQSSEDFPRIGNPNLNPAISVQYELGGGHQFTRDMAAKLSLFYKDIYDYPTSTTLVLSDRQTTQSDFFIYRNIDYSRARGVEFEWRKQRTVHASWAASYTYSVAKGKSSDPNALKLVQASGGDSRQTSLDEEYMWWNRPHKFTFWYDFRVNHGEHRPSFWGVRFPDDASVNLYYMLQSGHAYTPMDVLGNQTGQTYSKNGPYEAVLNGTLTKGFRVGGRRFEVLFQGWNLFNQRTPTDVDPATGNAWKPGQGSLNTPYEDPANLTLSDPELVRKAGLRVGPDQTVGEVALGIRRTIWATIYKYQDPSLRAAPRNFRVGIGMEW